MDNKPTQEAIQAEAKTALGRLKEVQAHENWVETATSPCKIFKMEIDGRTASKGQAIVNYNIQEVFKFLSQITNLKRLNNQINKIQIMHVYSDDLKVNYQGYDGMWPVAGRDVVLVTTREKTDTKIYMPAKSCEFGIPEVKGIVRAQVFIGGYILEKIDENKTKATYISDTDIKGSIPSMIKNQLNKKQGSIPSRIESEMNKDKK